MSTSCTDSGSGSSAESATSTTSTLTSRRAGAGGGSRASSGVPIVHRRSRGGHRQRQRRVLREDGAFELAEALARLDAELVDERAPCVLVGLQRVRLAVAAEQREHQLGAQTLAVRVLGDQRRQAADHVGVAPQREVGLDLLLERDARAAR